LELINQLCSIPLALAEDGGVMALINIPVIISSAIGFVVFFFVMKKMLWKPTLTVIDERRESIEQAFQEVDDARADMAKLKAELEERLAKINQESQEQLNAAVAKGQEIAQQVKVDAEEQRERLLAKTHEDIAREKDKAVAELRNTAIDLSFEISRRVLKDGLDRERHDNLVASFIDELKGMN
jgi:F-type H+-transporting ATPase subunit b